MRMVFWTIAARMDYEKNITFPQLLQGAGYKTAIYGKWHLKTAPQGFDDWAVLPGQGSYHNPDYRVKDGVGEKKVRINGWVMISQPTWLLTF